MDTDHIGVGFFAIVFGIICYYVGNAYFSSTGGPVGYLFCELLALICIPAGLWIIIGEIIPIKNDSKNECISAIIASILFFIIGIYLLRINLIGVAIFSGILLIIGISKLF